MRKGAQIHWLSLSLASPTVRRFLYTWVRFISYQPAATMSAHRPTFLFLILSPLSRALPLNLSSVLSRSLVHPSPVCSLFCSFSAPPPLKRINIQTRLHFHCIYAFAHKIVYGSVLLLTKLYCILLVYLYSMFYVLYKMCNIL